MKQFIFSILLLFLVLPVFAQDGDINCSEIVGTYVGTIYDAKTTKVLKIYIERGGTNEFWGYSTVNDKNSTRFSGTAWPYKGTAMKMEEPSSNGKNGIFECGFQDETPEIITGRWISYDGTLEKYIEVRKTE
jgi:hypothetical protein